MTFQNFAWLSSYSTRSRHGKRPTETASAFPELLSQTPWGSCAEDALTACMSMHSGGRDCCLTPSNTPVEQSQTWLMKKVSRQALNHVYIFKTIPSSAHKEGLSMYLGFWTWKSWLKCCGDREKLIRSNVNTCLRCRKYFSVKTGTSNPNHALYPSRRNTENL